MVKLVMNAELVKLVKTEIGTPRKRAIFQPEMLWNPRCY